MNNQTDPAWLSNVSESEPGTGLFLVEANSKEAEIFNFFRWQDREEGVIKGWIRGITYYECVRYGRYSLAFKWIPKSIVGFSSLLNTPCARRPCNQSCVEPGCLCNPHTGFCE